METPHFKTVANNIFIGIFLFQIFVIKPYQPLTDQSKLSKSFPHTKI